jgi:hypothetical protein
VTHIAIEDANALSGRTLADRDGARIGTIEGPLGGAEDGLAAWLAVNVDDAGQRAVIPVVDLVLGGDAVGVPYARYQVLEAPQVKGDDVEVDEDHALRAWYGLPAIDGSTSEGRPQFRHPGIDLD